MILFLNRPDIKNERIKNIVVLINIKNITARTDICVV